MILRSTRAARGRWTSLSTVWPRLLWCRSTKSARYCSHKCSADSTSSPHNRQAASSEIPSIWVPAPKSRVKTTAEANQVGEFSVGKGRLDSVIRERQVHLLQPLVLDGMGETGTAEESSLCSWLKCVVGLSLCSTQFSLLAS